MITSRHCCSLLSKLVKVAYVSPAACRRSSTFSGIVIEKQPSYNARLDHGINKDSLPEGDVEVGVHFSTLNYKDGLAITGKGPVVRKFPMVPGIDLSGTVTSSASTRFALGDKVELNGWGVGEGHWGGLAQHARLKSDWLIKLPDRFSPWQAMAIGTAGYTAMLSVIALEKHGVTPDKGDILVTGANGGVGSVSVALLSKLGYNVVAATGRPDQADYLHELGATRVIPRSELSEKGRVLNKELYAGAIDSAGSHTLANACASTKYGGCVAACGLAQGMTLEHSVAPFILRGVTLAGIDSVMRPLQDRVEAWERLAGLVSDEQLHSMTETIGLGQVVEYADKLMNGQVRGRVIVDCSKV